MEYISQVKTLNKPKLGITDNFSRNIVLKACAKIQVGHLTIEDESGIHSFGESQATAAVVAHITVHDLSTYFDFFFHGTVGSGEAYMRNAWSTPDLLSVIRLMVLNIQWLSKFNAERPWYSRLLLNIGHKLNNNTLSGSRKNIAAHYDLGNDFFSLFLDPTMMYSSAIYNEKTTSLEQASVNKLETICRKLKLTEHDHLLEIGTGWGGMAMYAAEHYGCKVTTTTISKEQYDFAKEKVKHKGLDNKITLLLEDYRDLEGQYSKIVSIEMIEAVGFEFYENYFAKCSSLLANNGMMLIQAITIPDQRYDYARKSTDFIKQYIFPGGCLPSNEVIAQCVSQHTDMQIIGLQDITQDYAKTLADWHDRFQTRIDDVKAQGFSDSFCRMWEFYLCYCEGGFRERVISTSQLLFAKPSYRH